MAEQVDQPEEPLPEIPFPAVQTSQGPGRFSVTFTFGHPEDFHLFHYWLVKGGGWAEFGEFADSQPPERRRRS